MKLEIILSRISRWRTALSAHRTFIGLLAVFVVFRMLSVLAFRPGGFFVFDGADNDFLFEIGRLSGSGKVALFDFWMEYPPLVPWLAALIYQWTLHIPAWGEDLFIFNVLFRSVMLAFDAGSLILIYLTARRLGTPERAIETAAVWAMLFSPLAVLLGWFESLPVFFMLLALYALVIRRPALAGWAMGFGFMVKVYPAILWPLGWFTLRSRRQRMIYAAASACAALSVVGVPLIVSPVYTIATFRNFLNRASWETIWAVFDGYLSYGKVAPLAEHVDPARAGLIDHASSLPWLPISLFFAGVYLWLLTRRIDWKEPRRIVQFGLFSLVWFLLYSKGYSPQWGALLGGFLLLALPGARGVFYALWVDIMFVLEWLVALIFVPEIPGVLIGVIALRTLMWGAMAVECAVRFLPERAESRPGVSIGRWFRRWTAPALLGINLLAGIGFAGPVWQAMVEARLQGDLLRDWVRGVRSGTLADDPALVFQPHLLERLAPQVPEGRVRLFPGVGDRAWEPVEAWLKQGFARTERAWLFYDTGRTTNPALYETASRWLETHACRLQQQTYGSIQAGLYLWNELPVQRLLRSDRFEPGVSLVEATVPQGPVTAGRSLCVRLMWETAAPLSEDYAVFVHLIGPDGRLLAQGDGWPAHPSRSWEPGRPVASTHGITLPADLRSGTYSIRVGLYRIADGTRLRLTDGADALTVTELQVAAPAP